MVLCFCKPKAAYEMRISDCGSDVCSSDLCRGRIAAADGPAVRWPAGAAGRASRRARRADRRRYRRDRGAAEGSQAVSAGPLIAWGVETLIAMTLLMLLVLALRGPVRRQFGSQDRKSTRLNSSH